MASLINSVHEFIDAIKLEISTHNQVLWFRGHRESHWAVQPAVWRDYNKDGERPIRFVRERVPVMGRYRSTTILQLG